MEDEKICQNSKQKELFGRVTTRLAYMEMADGDNRVLLAVKYVTKIHSKRSCST